MDSSGNVRDVPNEPGPAWGRLGGMLIRRRLELDPRYRNRRTFVEERAELKLYRIINDMERGRRGNYEAPTKAAVEAAYDLPPGTIDRAVDGGELLPALAAVADLPADPGADPGDVAMIDSAVRLAEAIMAVSRMTSTSLRNRAGVIRHLLAAEVTGAETGQQRRSAGGP